MACHLQIGKFDETCVTEWSWRTIDCGHILTHKACKYAVHSTGRSLSAYLQVALSVGRPLRATRESFTKSSVEVGSHGRQLTSSEVNFFCWNICFRASDVGAHVPFDLERQRSLREARIETTKLRLSGLSGEAMQYELPSPRTASVEEASVRTAAASEAPGFGLLERTDIGFWWLVFLLTRHR